MKPNEMVSLLYSVSLLPAGLALVSLALRGHYLSAMAIFAIGITGQLLLETSRYGWSHPDSLAQALPQAARRVFVLLALAALHSLGSCPAWFLAFVIAATLVQWSVFFLVRPSRLAPPLLPELKPWNALCQAALIAIFFCDFALIAAYPNNFRFSETFHLAGYSFLASLLTLHLAHDFYRMRRALLYWLRSLAYQS
ncbi:hypothetical protein K2X33_07380 [bacterium]|nr:hypothetical protein [bacterium]